MKCEFHIITNKKHVIYNERELSQELPVPRFPNFKFIPTKDLYISSFSGDSVYKGSCLFKSNDLNKWEELYTKQQLWEFLQEFHEIKEASEKWDSKDFLFFRGIKLFTTSYDEDIFICIFSFNNALENYGGSCLFYIDLENFKIVKKIYLPNCYAIIVNQLSETALVASTNYYDGQISEEYVFEMPIYNNNMQIFRLNESVNTTVKLDSDVYSMNNIGNNNIIVNESGNRIHKINTTNMTIEDTLEASENEYFGPIVCQVHFR